MDIANLLASIRVEAQKGGFSIDLPVYERAGRDPLEPILFAGSLDSRVAFFARDLGRDEVLHGEPLIGGAGRRVRSAVYRHVTGVPAASGDRRLAPALDHILLTNTVPYKPVGNKAYPASVRERFRPYVASLLVCCWKGDYVITLGTEAFHWFAPYAQKGEADAFWKRKDRFEAEMPCVIRVDCDGGTVEKPITLAPVPHPSPLNQTYLELFPALLENRLSALPLR